MRRLRSLLHRRAGRVLDLFWIALAQGVMLCGGLASLKVVTSLLSPEEIGLYGLAFSTVLAVSAVIYEPLSKTGLRFLYGRAREKEPVGDRVGELTHEVSEGILPEIAKGFGKLPSNSLRALEAGFLKLHGLVAGLITVLSVVITVGFWGFDYPKISYLIICSTLLLLAQGIALNLATIVTGMRWFYFAAGMQALLAVLRSSLAFVAVLLLGSTAGQALLGMSFAFVIVCLVMIRKIANSSKLRESSPRYEDDADLLVPMVKFTTGLCATALVGAICMYGDRWIAAAFFDLAEVGRYAAMMTLAAGPVTALSTVLYRFSAPPIFNLSEHVGQPRRIRIKRAAKNISLLWAAPVFPVFFLCVFAHDPIVRLITNSDIAENSILLPFLVAGLALDRLANILCLIGQLMYETHIYAIARLLHLAVFLGVTVFLVPSFGLMSLGYAQVAAGAIFLLSVLHFNARVLRKYECRALRH